MKKLKGNLGNEDGEGEYFFYVDEVSIQRTHFTVEAESKEQAIEKASKTTPSARGVMRTWSNLFEDGTTGAWSAHPGFRGHSYFKDPVYIRKMASTYKELEDKAEQIAEFYGIDKGQRRVTLTSEGYKTEFSAKELELILYILGVDIDLKELQEKE